MLGAAPPPNQPINHIPVTQSVIGVALPLVFGTFRVPAILLWRGDLRAHAESASGKAKGGKNGALYAYTATVISALCHGPIFGIDGVWDQDGQLPTLPYSATFDTLPIPATPSLSYAAGGSIPAASYYVTVTYTNDAQESPHSAEASIAVPADSLLAVASPAASSGATGWNVYVATSSGGELLQNGSVAIALGTAWDEPSAGIAVDTPPHPQHGRIIAPAAPQGPANNVRADRGLLKLGKPMSRIPWNL